jgi:hypothetical protein
LSRFLKKNVGSKLLGEVTQESEIRELVQKTARDLVVVTAQAGQATGYLRTAQGILGTAQYRGHTARVSILSILHGVRGVVHLHFEGTHRRGGAQQIVVSSVGRHSILHRIIEASEEAIFGIIRRTARPTGEVS